jgi:flagellin-like protein
MGKRGLSPVVATSLLILLVLIAAGIIFVWMKGFMSEQITKFDKPAEDVCSEIEFDVQLNSISDLEVANRGNMPISSLEVKSFMENGDAKISKLSIGLNPGESASEPFTQYGQEVAKEIVVYPVILGRVQGKALNKMFTCVNQGKTIKI